MSAREYIESKVALLRRGYDHEEFEALTPKERHALAEGLEFFLDVGTGALAAEEQERDGTYEPIDVRPL